LAIIATVLLSIFAHGISTAPGISLYSRAVDKLSPDAPEKKAIEENGKYERLLDLR
jgi:hypothetical protein